MLSINLRKHRLPLPHGVAVFSFSVFFFFCFSVDFIAFFRTKRNDEQYTTNNIVLTPSGIVTRGTRCTGEICIACSLHFPTDIYIFFFFQNYVESLHDNNFIFVRGYFPKPFDKISMRKIKQTPTARGHCGSKLNRGVHKKNTTIRIRNGLCLWADSICSPKRNRRTTEITESS